MEAAYSKCRKRHRSELKKIALCNISWGAIHEAALTQPKESLQIAVKLAHVKEDHRISVFTDLSNHFWAYNVTQVPRAEAQKAVDNLKHEPISLLEGRFSESQKYWTTYEKEAFAIVKVFESRDYILWGPGPVRVYMDHGDLL